MNTIKLKQKFKNVRIISGELAYMRRGQIINKIPLYTLLRSRLRLRQFIRDTRSHFKKIDDKILNREPGYFIKHQENLRIRRINENKYPKTPERHFGIEIEFLSRESESSIKKAFAKAGLHQYVTYHSDSSVGSDSDSCDGSCRDSCECMYCSDPQCGIESCDHGRETDGAGNDLDCSRRHPCQGHDDFDCNCECNCRIDDGHEICVIVPENRAEQVIEQVCSVLNDRLDASVNKTCGLHVHLDMRKRHASKAYARLVNNQNLLRSLQPSSRRNNSFCRKNEALTLDAALENGSRYLVVNPHSLGKHKTLEVRVHSGTTDPIKIINWIRLLSHIAWKRKSSEEIQSFKELIQEGMPTDSVFYLASRYQKFLSESTDWKPADFAKEAYETIKEAA